MFVMENPAVLSGYKPNCTDYSKSPFPLLLDVECLVFCQLVSLCCYGCIMFSTKLLPDGSELMFMEELSRNTVSSLYIYIIMCPYFDVTTSSTEDVICWKIVVHHTV